MSELHDFCQHYDRCVCSPQKPTYQQLESELKAVREELRNANRGAEKNMHMTQLALKEKHVAEAERDRLLEIKEDYEILVDECVKYREALKDIALAKDAEELSETPDIARAALQSHTSPRGEDAPSEEKRK